jgi:hypothetical protein
MITEILWFLSWPLLIFFSYSFVKYAILKFERNKNTGTN